jgi:putative acetyltransferase
MMEADNLDIRQASLTDLDAICQVFEKSISTLAKPYYSEEERTAWIATSSSTRAKWRNRIDKDYFLVASFGNSLAGFISLKNKNYVDMLYTAPEFASKGVASKLYALLEQKAMDYQQPNLYVDASKVARPFFEKMGFELEKTNKNHRMGRVLVNYRMCKSF